MVHQVHVWCLVSDIFVLILKRVTSFLFVLRLMKPSFVYTMWDESAQKHWSPDGHKLHKTPIHNWHFYKELQPTINKRKTSTKSYSILQFTNPVKSVEFFGCHGHLAIDPLEFHLQVFQLNLIPVPQLLSGCYFTIQAINAVLSLVYSCL